MPDVFTIVIKKLQEMGAFNFLFPFMLTTAIFYGLLRKSKLFTMKKEQYTREKEGAEARVEIVEVGSAVNAVIAVIAGFLVWAYPILTGVNVEQELSKFFMQGTIVTLVLIVALLLSSMFLPPDLPGELKAAIGGNKAAIVLIITIVIGVVIFVTSGLLNIIVGPIFEGLDLSNDTVLTVIVLGLLIVPLIFIFKGDTGSSQNSSSQKNGNEKKEG